MVVLLPVIGARRVRQDEREPGHWLWLSFAGWCDCFPREDEHINAVVQKINAIGQE